VGASGDCRQRVRIANNTGPYKNIGRATRRKHKHPQYFQGASRKQLRLALPCVFGFSRISWVFVSKGGVGLLAFAMQIECKSKSKSICSI
jgi:hypothetical protein